MFLAMLLIGVVTALAPQHALAAGTASGTTINNKATVNYQAGGIAQTLIESSPTGNTTPGAGAGANTWFYVANKVNVVVTKTGDATVIPGSTKQALIFTITNSGNTSQRYALAANLASGQTMSNVTIYRDNGTTPNQWDASDTLYVDASTFGNIVSDATFTVLVVSDAPLTLTNGQTGVYNLIATTVDAGTLNVTAQTAGAANLQLNSPLDVVYADAAGTDDVARDGKMSARGTYTASAPVLTVTKTTAVYWDPFNLTTNPKAIPGAVMTYTVTIANGAGGATATSVSVVDAIPANTTFKTTYVDASTTCAGTNGIVVGAGGAGVCKTNAGADDNADYNVTNAGAVTVTGLSVAAGASAVVRFQITIN
jgi:uncharacterized repeat protein (TIGR01451 family)